MKYLTLTVVLGFLVSISAFADREVGNGDVDGLMEPAMVMDVPEISMSEPNAFERKFMEENGKRPDPVGPDKNEPE